MDMVSMQYAPLTISTSPDETLSPSSPKSWEESFDQLSKGLQFICGGNGQEGSTRGSADGQRTSPKLLSPPKQGFPRLLTADRSAPRVRPLSPHPRHPGRSIARCHSSSATCQLTVNGRPLIIRHEESQERLEERLAQICSVPGNSPSSPPDVTTTAKYACKLRKKDSLRGLFRAQVDVSKYNRKDLIVCLCNNELLQVWARNADCLEHICEHAVPKTLRCQRLSCFVTENQTLCIREKTDDVMDASLVNHDRVYFPVFYEDENNLKLQIILHIYNELDFEDIHVKTVDDDLVITGQKQPTSSTIDEDVQMDPLDFSLSLSPTPIFRLSVKLPEGVESRTVSGSLLENNQLVIHASMTSSSRRYTF